MCVCVRAFVCMTLSKTLATARALSTSGQHASSVLPVQRQRALQELCLRSKRRAMFQLHSEQCWKMLKQWNPWIM